MVFNCKWSGILVNGGRLAPTKTGSLEILGTPHSVYGTTYIPCNLPIVYQTTVSIAKRGPGRREGSLEPGCLFSVCVPDFTSPLLSLAGPRLSHACVLANSIATTPCLLLPGQDRWRQHSVLGVSDPGQLVMSIE